MIVQCPRCGQSVVVKGLGRKALNFGVKNVYDALQHNRSIAEAASELGCSRAYIYKVLRVNGLTPREVIQSLSQKNQKSKTKGIDYGKPR
jgi:AraC-like DNA-binding protein